MPSPWAELTGARPSSAASSGGNRTARILHLQLQTRPVRPGQQARLDAQVHFPGSLAQGVLQQVLRHHVEQPGRQGLLAPAPSSKGHCLAAVALAQGRPPAAGSRLLTVGGGPLLQLVQGLAQALGDQGQLALHQGLESLGIVRFRLFGRMAKIGQGLQQVFHVVGETGARLVHGLDVAHLLQGPAPQLGQVELGQQPQQQMEMQHQGRRQLVPGEQGHVQGRALEALGEGPVGQPEGAVPVFRRPGAAQDPGQGQHFLQGLAEETFRIDLELGMVGEAPHPLLEGQGHAQDVTGKKHAEAGKAAPGVPGPRPAGTAGRP